MGEKARHYRQTDVHEHSSRSHSIFRILIENRMSESRRIVVEKSVNDGSFLEGSDEIGQKHLSYGTKYSMLNLVDLAGSERQGKTQATG